MHQIFQGHKWLTWQCWITMLYPVTSRSSKNETIAIFYSWITHSLATLPCKSNITLVMKHRLFTNHQFAIMPIEFVFNKVEQKLQSGIWNLHSTTLTTKTESRPMRFMFHPDKNCCQYHGICIQNSNVVNILRSGKNWIRFETLMELVISIC